MPAVEGDRLDSWKVIAGYLNRDIRTVQLWEKEQGLPIHRHYHARLPSVYAFKSELDGWAEQRTERPKMAALVQPPGRARMLSAAAALLIIISGVVVVKLFSGGEPTPQPTAAPVSRPFTSYPGNEASPSFSPDGSRVVFAWDGPAGANPDIYTQQVGFGQPVRLTMHAASDHDPAWSPDGKWIAFLRDISDAERIVALVPSLGGTEQIVTRTRIVKDTPYSLEAPLLSWSADNRYLFTLDTQEGNAGPYAISRISIDNGRTELLTSPDRHEVGERAVAASPNGRLIAFSRQMSDTFLNLYVSALGGSDQRKLACKTLVSKVRMEGFTWSPDSRTLVFFGEIDGSSGFWIVDVATGQLARAVGVETMPFRLKRMGRSRGTTLAVSPDGRQLIFSRARFDVNLWRIDLAVQGKIDEHLFAASTLDESQPAYSPDGQNVAFESDRSGSEEIWTSAADGSRPKQLTNFGSGLTGSPRFSTNGRQVAFDRFEKNNWDVYVVNTQGGQPIRRTSKSSSNVLPNWSKDGRWIYSSSDRTGRFEIWKVPAAEGPDIHVTSNGGVSPDFSTDGEMLYYTRSIGEPNTVLWRMPAEGGREEKVVEHLFSGKSFAITSRGIYFLRGKADSPIAPFSGGSDPHAVLVFFDLKTHKTRALASLPGNNLVGRFTVSPDERFLVYGRDDGTGSDLMLADNFR